MKRVIIKKQAEALIVIPNWNGREFIGETLQSLEKQSADVLVVDNGSVDGSVDYLEQKFPNIILLKEPRNLGFAGGVNIGIRYALAHNYKYVALFNNDALAGENWLRTLVNATNTHSKTGIVTGKLMLMDKKHLDSTGDFYSTIGMPFPRGRHEKDIGQYDEAEEVFGGSGGASLYKTELFKEIGLFDEDFFAYFEDVDISFRAQLAGWKVWYEPRAVAYHRLSATSSQLGTFSYYHTIKNFLLLYDRNMPTILYWKYLPLFMYQFARMFAGSIKHGLFFVFMRAVIRVLLLTPKTLRLRSRRRSLCRVSVAQIDRSLYHAKPPTPPILERNSG